MIVSRKNKKRILQASAIVWLSFVMSGCANTPSGKRTNNNDAGNTKEFLQSLSPQQKMTLLSLLESYDENQEAIDSWKQNEASINRLVELESDLKLLIMQLNNLSKTAQASTPSLQAEQVKAETEVETTAGESASDTPSPAVKTTPQRSAPSADASSVILQGYTIQLVAVYSLSHLRTYWQNVKSSYPVMFSEAVPFYERFTNAKGENVFRLKVGKYETKADATRVCREFSTKGGSCFVTSNTAGELLD